VLIIGSVVILYGLLMVFLAYRLEDRATAGVSPPATPRRVTANV
jgi:hypothetical protein